MFRVVTVRIEKKIEKTLKFGGVSLGQRNHKPQAVPFRMSLNRRSVKFDDFLSRSLSFLRTMAQIKRQRLTVGGALLQADSRKGKPGSASTVFQKKTKRSLLILILPQCFSELSFASPLSSATSNLSRACRTAPFVSPTINVETNASKIIIMPNFT